MTSDQTKFKRDMIRAGFEPETYRGRFFYKGYAVVCGDEQFQEVLAATKVKLQWDQMGKGLVVYPKVGMSEKEFLEAIQ